MTKKYCSCINCQTRDRWEATLYTPYLKNNINEEVWINRQRAIDKKVLFCLNELPDYMLDADDDKGIYD